MLIGEGKSLTIALTQCDCQCHFCHPMEKPLYLCRHICRWTEGHLPLLNINIERMNKITFNERLNQRVIAIEMVLRKLEPVEDLLRRLAQLEENIYTTKNVLTFKEACLYMGISESLLYKLTAANEIPYYKPRGKLNYFEKAELDEWLMQNRVPTIRSIVEMHEMDEDMIPYHKKERYGKRKKQ